MKYEVGDVVRVRPDLMVGKAYGSCLFTSEMEPYLGKEVTICQIEQHGWDEYCRIAEDNEHWCWADEMLEDIDPVEITPQNEDEFMKMLGV